MLAELALANAAFEVIKTTIGNGQDIMAAGQHLFSFFDNKAKIAQKASQSGSDSEAFFALEAIRQNEELLKEALIYQGRAGLWDDWLKFQSDAKRKREAEARAITRAKIKRKELIWSWVNGIIITICVLTGLVVVAGLIWIILHKGI